MRSGATRSKNISYSSALFVEILKQYFELQISHFEEIAIGYKTLFVFDKTILKT